MHVFDGIGGVGQQWCDLLEQYCRIERDRLDDLVRCDAGEHCAVAAHGPVEHPGGVAHRMCRGDGAAGGSHHHDAGLLATCNRVDRGLDHRPVMRHQSVVEVEGDELGTETIRKAHFDNLSNGCELRSTAKERLKGGRDTNTAIGLLVILQNRHDDARHRA